MRVARHEFEGVSQLSRPAALESSLNSGFVISHSLNGERIPNSVNARIPGLTDGSSDAFVASITIS